jgi:hypothetical protein
MRRLAALAVVALASLAATASAAHAIETSEFGVAPTGPRQHLNVSVRPGHTSTDSVRVWNKTDHPVTLRISVVGASVNGPVQLGGNGGGASWVRLSRDQVTLPPKATDVVSFSVHAPRQLPPDTSTAAVVVEPVVAGQGSVSVVQRVAVMAYFAAPAGSPLRAALGWLGWAALAALVLVVLYAVAPVRRQARRVSRLATLRRGPRQATAELTA